jgi:subtilisin family serine protease
MKKLLLKIVFSTLTIVNFTGCDSSSSTSLNNYYLDKNNTNSFNEETLNNNILEENRSFTTLDPLFQYQWHLSALRVPEIWEKYTGRGIKVAIVDSGIEKNHPDLIDNLDLNLSYRYSDKSSDPTPDENQLVYLPADSGHGTSCAGIIGAVTNNNLGVAGVAPDVELVGLNTFSSGLDADFEDALGNLNIDISNNSWGGDSASVLYDDPWSLNGIEQGIKKGRNGKGIIYVFASGNEGGNSNYSILHGSKYILNIGAVTYNAKVPFYSNYGDNILIGAPAGDVDPSSGFGIFTTDLMGEKYGFDGKDSLTKTLKLSGNPGIIILRPFTIDSYIRVRPRTSSDLTVKNSCNV